MKSPETSLIDAMIEFDHGDPKRIQHFLKVWAFARLIGVSEGLDKRTQSILEAAAIVHDIGIHACEEKYGHTGGRQQEEEGAPLALGLLRDMGYPDEIAERVSWLVGHHHTYAGVRDIDHQILLEADFLVNSYEDNLDGEQIREFCARVFRTRSGIRLLELQSGIGLSGSRL